MVLDRPLARGSEVASDARPFSGRVENPVVRIRAKVLEDLHGMFWRTTGFDGREEGASLWADEDGVITQAIRCGFNRRENSCHLDLRRRDGRIGLPELTQIGTAHTHPGASAEPSPQDIQGASTSAYIKKRPWLSLIYTVEGFRVSDEPNSFWTDSMAQTTPAILEVV